MKQLKFKQIISAEWEGNYGQTYSIIALSEDGRVYRYDAKCEGWIPWSMDEATCKDDHKGKR